MAQKRNLSATPTRRHAAPLRVPAPPRALHWGLSVKPRRCSHHLAAAPQRSQELITELRAMDEEALQAWALANRAALTLDLLSAVAQVHAAAEGNERERLWAMGSKLLAVREGLVPVSNKVLMRELRAAAAKSCSAQQSLPAAAESASKGGVAANGRGGDNGSQQASASSSGSSSSSSSEGGAQIAKRPQPQFSYVAQRTAQLGLTPEGMTLLQQQATSLEIAVGASRAKSLAEVIGRKELAVVEGDAGLGALFEPDAAARILQLLLTIPDRTERAALLPDAFSPAESGDEAEGGPTAASCCCEEGGEEEELLSTTPLALLQAIDLQLKRLRAPAEVPSVAGLLAVAVDDLPLEEAAARLQQLREDVAAYWAESDVLTSGEEF